MAPDERAFGARQIPAIRVAGELDMAGAEELAGLVAASLPVNPPLLIDLSGVSFMDMSGWRAIWDSVRQVKRNEISAVVIASPAAMHLLRHLPLKGDERIRVVEAPISVPNQEDRPEEASWWRSEMFDQIGDAILVADETMAYLDANSAAVKLLGWSVEELRERSVADVVAAQRTWTEDEYERFVRDGRWRGEVLLRSRTGSVTADANASTILGPNGRKVFTSVIREHALAKEDVDLNGDSTEHGGATSSPSR